MGGDRLHRAVGDRAVVAEQEPPYTSVAAGGRHRSGRGWTDPTARPSIERWLPRAFHGTDAVLAVEVVLPCAPAGEAELVVEVAALVGLVVVVLAGAVLVTVVVEVLFLTVVVELLLVTDVRLAFLFAVAEPPKNVVGWPLSMIECPARRSGTV